MRRLSNDRSTAVARSDRCRHTPQQRMSQVACGHETGVCVYKNRRYASTGAGGLRLLSGESANVTANALIMSEMHVTVKVTFRMPIGGKALTVF
ncbi:MAG: hypothetical protein IJ155_04620 [Prevotella sp.]|nr:hypothetical protein [Prevotella sp.]